MRILLINQFFWPDSAATSQLLTDLARGLNERGHEVFVIAGKSGYAPDEADDPPSATVYRVRSVPFARGSVGRVLSYGSFFISSLALGLKFPRPDLVVTLTTPPLISLV